MHRLIRFHPAYAALALGLLLSEVAIARWFEDRLIRPYLGDTLAVLLVYCSARAVTRLSIGGALILALGVAFMVELSQLFGFVERIGLHQHQIARTVLGTGFDYFDFIAYLGGGLVALCCEASLDRTKMKRDAVM
jgi:hypothetical protein